jgi:PAS domain S-box-containing protein
MRSDPGSDPEEITGEFPYVRCLLHQISLSKTAESVKRSARSPVSNRTTPVAHTIVGIGASAGGLEAFTELLKNLPEQSGFAFVLVQHLDPTHRSLLSELLGKVTSIPVVEIEQNAVASPNCIYVIPPNTDLSIEQGVLKLKPRKKNGGAARSIDHFLTSLAQDQKQNAIGIILSGAGSDGAEGLRAIKEAGGLTFAQDAETAKYDSMPRSAIATNCVDFVLPPKEIAEEIARLIRAPELFKSRAAKNARTRTNELAAKTRTFTSAGSDGTKDPSPMAWPVGPEDPDLRKIFVILRARSGVDFSFYRINTIRRRLARRLTITKCKDLERYVRLLRENPSEVDTLYQDLLINVTGFFRNPTVFDALKRKVFPKLVKDKSGNEPLRFWIAGCSTGQEAYSLAIAFTEFAESKGIHRPLQIFATDVNAAVLDVARGARYSRAQMEGVSAERVKRFFVPENDEWRVIKPIRDLVIFAQQDIITDPPFTRVDLISCRNMLIYIEPALQQKIIPAFHYALRPDGFLLLGASESTGQFGHLFETVEAKHKIFSKKPGATWIRTELPPALPPLRLSPDKSAGVPLKSPAVDAPKEADRLLLNRYAPVAVLINEDAEILHFRGDTRKYLNLPAGKASFQLLKMARHGLALPIQRALLRAKKEDKVVAEKEVRFEGTRGSVTIEVLPLKNIKPRHFLVVFQKPQRREKEDLTVSRGRNGNGVDGHSRADAKMIGELRHELTETREHLHSLQEEYDTSIEELQASNEEVQSANEELQSLNEELETSNEELESSNEELTTLNEELATRNAELRESERRLREQAELLELAPVLARSPKDRIVFWNTGAEKLYGFTKEEALGQTSHLLLSATYSEPLEKIQAKLMREGHWEGEVQHRRKSGDTIWVNTQWVVHYDEKRKVRAILEVNADITARKQAERALADSEKFSRTILESSPDCIKVLDTNARVVFINAKGQELMELPDAQAIRNVYWPSLWEGDARTAAENAYRDAFRGATTRFQGFRRTPKGTPKWWDVLVQPIMGPDGHAERIVAASRDITEYKREEERRAQLARLSAMRAEIAMALSTASDLAIVLQRVSEAISRHLEAAVARIWTRTDEKPVLRLRASAGPLKPTPGTYDQLKLGDRRIGKIAAEKTPYLTNDAIADPEIGDVEWTSREKIVSFAGYPLLVDSNPVGVIAVYSQARLEARVLEELGLTADALAQFIQRKNAEAEQARLLQEALEARKEVEILNEIGQRISAELDATRLALGVLESASRLIRAEFGVFIYELPGDGSAQPRYAVHGMRPFPDGDTRVQEMVSAASRELARGVRRIADLLAGDASLQNLPFAQPQGRLVARSYLSLPVVSRSGEVIGGFIFGHSQPAAFGDREERMMIGVASQAAIGLDNARLFGQLERKVAERTARLNDTVSELQAFSYTVSHDLRAPLRAMQSYAQVLQEECADQLNDTAKGYLSRIERAGARLDRLIQDVLTYGRISRTELQLHALDVVKLIHEIIQQYPALQAPKAEIEIKEPIPQVVAEESSVTQCFSNLLGNAVKFVRDGVKPHVKIYSEDLGSKIRLWVEDNGIGIAPCHHERIFKMFERVDGHTKYDGTGIGLAIVRKAMERMGGQVGLVSDEGKGCKFWLEFVKA